MAIATPHPTPVPLTYEEYLAEGEINARYDIVDGVRILMPGPKWKHQVIVVNTIKILDRYKESVGSGYVIPAPFDVLIRKLPKLQTRQPDVLFISQEQIERGGGIPDSGALEIAPELVVEILSDSETEHTIQSEIADYIEIGVKECWLIRQDARTVELLRLTAAGSVSVAVYDETTTLQSVVFPDLNVTVADLFK